MASDLVEAMSGKAEQVDVHFELPEESRKAVEQARTTSAGAQRHASVAAQEYRQAVRGLVIDRGMSKADVAALLQLSQQRGASSFRSHRRAIPYDQAEQLLGVADRAGASWTDETAAAVSAARAGAAHRHGG